MKTIPIRLLLGVACACALLAAGCTNRNTWRPTIDPYNNPNQCPGLER